MSAPRPDLHRIRRVGMWRRRIGRYNRVSRYASSFVGAFSRSHIFALIAMRWFLRRRPYCGGQPHLRESVAPVWPPPCAKREESRANVSTPRALQCSPGVPGLYAPPGPYRVLSSPRSVSLSLAPWVGFAWRRISRGPAFSRAPTDRRFRNRSARTGSCVLRRGVFGAASPCLARVCHLRGVFGAAPPGLAHACHLHVVFGASAPCLGCAWHLHGVLGPTPPGWAHAFHVRGQFLSQAGLLIHRRLGRQAVSCVGLPVSCEAAALSILV